MVLEYATHAVVVQTSLLRFDVTAVAVVGCEYDYSKVQHYSHKAMLMFTVCQLCICSVASWPTTTQPVVLVQSHKRMSIQKEMFVVLLCIVYL